MKIRADALAQNPQLVSWEAMQKWDGKLPRVRIYRMGVNNPRLKSGFLAESL